MSRAALRPTKGRLREACARAWQRLTSGFWPLLQQTAAATVAWLVALYVGDHQDPFFAPIAAVVALNAPFGERGLNALRLLQGVVVGIAVGQLPLIGLGGGAGRLAIAVFVAMAIARALGGARVAVAQAAAAAILTVTLVDGEGGMERLVDALIGTGVALVFSQFLFSPEPLRFLRRAETDALSNMARALRLTAQALAADGPDLAEQAIRGLHDLRDHLPELSRVRLASTRVARHSLVWRWRTAPVVAEKENAGHLDLLGVSCLMLTRAGLATSTEDQAFLAPRVAEVADIIDHLSTDPGGRATRQHAVDQVLDVARRLTEAGPPPPESALDMAVMMIRAVAADVMVFTGEDPQRAARAVREGTGNFRANAAPSSPAASLLPRLRRLLPTRR